MNQRTHTWLAIRALALLEDEGAVPQLVALLKPHVRSTAIGTWIPDLADSKRGGGDIDNHIFKLAPYTGRNTNYYALRRDELFEKLGPRRKMRDFIDAWDGVLGANWWGRPYKADPQPGQHLPNRAMALTVTLADQLILGDPDVAARLPGRIGFAAQLDPEARSRPEEVATYFFMMSHFVADACQPCHCDVRRLSGYSRGLHKQMESHWSRLVGTYFDKRRLLSCGDDPRRILTEARNVDASFGLSFRNQVPGTRARDTWLETLNVCCASFAIASILAPPADFPYDGNDLTSYAEVFESSDSDARLLPELDRAIMHDAVLNIAIAWKGVWRKFD